MHDTTKPVVKTALITGASRRIGAAIARRLHGAGMNILLHYRHSHAEAESLAQELNALRSDSVLTAQADLLVTENLANLLQVAIKAWGGLDILVNNASEFYSTPIGTIQASDWEKLMGSNLKAPLFLSQIAVPYLKKSSGTIINITDIHGEKPMRHHTVYSMAKAGLAALTRSLARELAPEVRVNAVAPGAILWPEQEMGAAIKNIILERIPLGRQGRAEDIAETVLFLAQSPYITGQIIAVDGGRSLHM